MLVSGDCFEKTYKDALKIANDNGILTTSESTFTRSAKRYFEHYLNKFENI